LSPSYPPFHCQTSCEEDQSKSRPARHVLAFLPATSGLSIAKKSIVKEETQALFSAAKNGVISEKTTPEATTPAHFCSEKVQEEKRLWKCELS